MLTAGIAHLTTLSLRPVLHLCSARNVDRVDVWLNLDARLEALRARVNWKSPTFCRARRNAAGSRMRVSQRIVNPNCLFAETRDTLLRVLGQKRLPLGSAFGGDELRHGSVFQFDGHYEWIKTDRFDGGLQPAGFRDKPLLWII
jgi:hypothetical protein